MNTENEEKKLKEILINMNSTEITLEKFYEVIEKETGGKLTFSSFKALVDQNYPNINKLDKIFLLRHITIDQSGRINLCDLFNYFSNILGQTIASPILAFYNIAYIIEKKLKISTVEFIFKNGLNLEDEININDFCLKIANNLKIDDIATIIVFKGLDVRKKGKIKVEDFVVVIDSYREDNSTKTKSNQNSSNFQANLNAGDKDNWKLLNYLNDFAALFKNESITIEEIFPNTEQDLAISYELYVTIKNLVRSIDSDSLESVLNFLKREENKIFKEDVQNLIEAKEIDKGFVLRYLRSKRKTENKFILNDTQIYWINKLLSLLDIIGLTYQMAFEIATSDSKRNEISLDNYKRKLQKLIPPSRVTAIELNSISDSLDINKNKFINFEDYTEILEQARNDPKFSIVMKSSDNFLGASSNPLINSFMKSSTNFSELPVKGNTKVISALKTDLSNTKKFPEEEKFIPTESITLTDSKKETKESQVLKIEKDLIKEFFKDLEVFENGEWSLIEILEDIELHKMGLLPIAELNFILNRKFSPTISRNKIFHICKDIDENKDGFFTYNNLITFCLNHLRHRSTKLALKEIARKIEFEHNLATEDFFARRMLQLNSEMNFVIFTQFFYKYFQIEPPVIKKIFQEMKSILSNRSNIFVSDVVDLINEYRIEDEKYEDSKISKDKNSTLSLLDKKFYEEEMKSFVKFLQKGICAYNSKNPTEIINCIDVCLDLPTLMTLSQFREKFIKPLSMNFSLGIATFQLLKSFSRKEEVTISKEDLYNLLQSYINPSVTEMEPELILFFIENNFSPLKFCFESIPCVHNSQGVATHDILKQMTNIYPKLNRKMIINILKAIDVDQMGVVTFKNLSDFLFKFSKRSQHSNNLIIKHLASILDYKNSADTNEFINTEMKLKKGERFINISKHLDFFVNKLNYNNSQAQSLYLYLSENSPIKDNYIFERLVRLLNTHRHTYLQKSRSLVYDNSSQVEAIKSQQQEYTQFLRTLDQNVKLSQVFDSLSIGETLNISIIDLFKAFERNYKSILDFNKMTLIRFFKSVDTDRKGYLPYEKFLKIIHNHLNEFQPSILLHSKYVANKIFKEFEGNWKNYVNYKGLTLNKSLTHQQFETVFQEELIGNEFISFNLFELLKQKKGSHSNMISIQNVVEYFSNLVRQSSGINSESKTDEIENVSLEESEDIIKNTILKLENKNNFYFKNIFEKINLKNINQFGKINSELMRSCLKEFVNLEESTIKLFIKYFCKVLNLFDLHKLVEFLITNSKKSRTNLQAVAKKIGENIPMDKTANEFSKLYNFKLSTPLNLIEFCRLSTSLFKLSNFESFFLFDQTCNNDNNPLKEEFKVNLDFIMENFSLYSLFARDASFRKSDKTKLDPTTIVCLEKLSTYLDSIPNKMKIFKEFDKDSNGVLNRTEFLNLLISIKEAGLNDLQQIKVLDFADKNRDDSINYFEFVNLINEFKPDRKISNLNLNMVNNSNSKNLASEKSSKNTHERFSLIDADALKQNYEFNSKNLKNRLEIPIETIIFYIQEEIFNTVHLKNNLEDEIIDIDKNNSKHINKDVFFELLKKRGNLKDYIEEEVQEKLWNYSLEGLNNKTKNKLLLDKLVNYKLFFYNICAFRFKLEMKKEEINEKLTKVDPKLDFKSEMKSIFKMNIKVAEKSKENENKLLQTFTKKMGEAIESNDDKTIENTKHLLFEGFTINSENKEPMNNPENQVDNFKEFITKITTLNYIGYDYKIDPNSDYFVRPDGTKLVTILNSEDAAIKKCEEIVGTLKDNESFFDKEFGSQPNDRGTRNKLSLYINGVAPKGHIDPNMIEWYKMNEICPDEVPLFIANGEESNDVMQGALGDCWIISAFSVLATKSHLLRGEFRPDILNDGEIDNEEAVMLSTGVYPPIFHCFRKYNIYCFRFYKNFLWRYVIIDDRLPCRKVYNKGDPKKLIYGKCRSENEFWVPLLEKAYAKLHGSYEALVSGFIDDGLVDLTGLVARKYNIGKEEIINSQSADKLWETIKQNSSIKFDDAPLKGKNSNLIKAQILTKNNSMIGCSVDAKVVESEVIYNNIKCGILAGHAYSILDTIEIPKEISKKDRHKSRLLRIRNPWGYKEWNGKWSDDSGELEKNREIIQKAFDEKYADSAEKVQLDAEDGSFLMCFSDFRKIFTRLFLCIDFPNSYTGILFREKWTKEESGGIPINNTPEEIKSWANNPQYYVKLQKETTFYISLMQQDGRLTNKKFPYADYTLKTCLVISKTEGKKKLTSFDSEKAMIISQIRQHRENSIHTVLPSGEYIISACTLKAGDVGDFALELHFEDSFIDDEYDPTNFKDKLKNTYIERLEKKVEAEIKKETSIEEIQDFKDRKKVFMYHQFKSLLLNEERKESNKTNQSSNVNNKTNKKKATDQEDEWEDY